MFLKKATKKIKGKEYVSYAITESYREGGQIKHRNVLSLGPLSEDKAQRVQMILKVTQMEDLLIGRLSDVVAKIHYRFLDVMLLHHLWQQWGLDRHLQELPMTEVMVINRCLDPKSKFQVNTWVKATVLPRVLPLESNDDDYAIYRTLDRLAAVEADLQCFLYHRIRELGLDDQQAVFYDITSTYFEGAKCILARFGYSRDNRPDREQITIALVVTPKGYPFYWRVMEGNTPDVSTVTGLLHDLKARFGIAECLLVFDRGMVSEDNLRAVDDAELNYVSALSRDEIPGLNILDVDLARCLTVDNWQQKLLVAGFTSYDENLAYQEYRLGVKRYILAFSHGLFMDQQAIWQQRYQKAEEYLVQMNTELQQAQKSRIPEKIKKQIDCRLKKLKMHKVFNYHLTPVDVFCRSKSGQQKAVRSFRVDCHIDQDALTRQTWLNGFICFVTNQPAEKLSAEAVINYYRRKNKIEEAFREIKHYLKLRPIFLTREKRVKAHVSVCVLGYLLLNTLDERLKNAGCPNSSVQVLGQAGKCFLNRIGLRGKEKYSESITEVTEHQQDILKQLGCSYLVSKEFASRLTVKQ